MSRPMDRPIAEADEMLGRTAAIVNRLLPDLGTVGVNSSRPSTPQERANDWSRIDRARERRRLHAAIYPRMKDKVRAKYGKTK